MSVAGAELLHLHVSAPSGSRYQIKVYRLGWYQGLGGTLVACVPNCTSSRRGVPQPMQAFDPTTGMLDAQWPVTDTLKVNPRWRSGYYVAAVEAGPGERFGVRVPFVVRSSTPSAPILVQVPVNTWEAYNAWGGRSLYVLDQSGVSNNHVSFERPYDTVPFADGSQQQWELPLLRFLDRYGFAADYATDADIDRNPDLLKRYRLVIVAGHSEYWTHATRDGFEAARDAGTNLAFLGANIGYWQIRYVDDTRTSLVEYRNRRLDPEPDPALKTTWFRKLTPARPECQLLGVQYDHRQGHSTIGAVTDYRPVTTGDAWFAGTGLADDSVLRALAGDEWDNMPAGITCAPGPTSVLFQSPGDAPAQAVRYTSPSGARVFSSGSLALNFGLDDNRFLPHHSGLESLGLERFLRNALVDLAAPKTTHH